MEQLTDLKAILHSKRANIYYLEKCRVMQKSGRVLYLTEEKVDKQYWNIPIANTTCILLGTGTSITQAAVRMLASAGVLIGFSGTGGTPLIAANEIEWLSPQSEYRPTEYIQGWMSFWFDEAKRLQAVSRKQSTMSEAKLNRLIKRGSISQDETGQYRLKMSTKALDNPFPELKSVSNGHKHRRYLQFGELSEYATEGEFDHFGLSKTATVP